MKAPWFLAAAAFALTVPAAHAQDAATPSQMTPDTTAQTTTTQTTTTQTTTTQSTTSAPVVATTGMVPPMMTGAVPNYALLADPLFDYTELKAARTKGLSESQVASIFRIAKLTGFSFREIEDKVLNGKTFAELAYEDNLKLSDVLDADTEKQQIAAYEAAYEQTGAGFQKNFHASGADTELQAMISKFQSDYAAFPSTTLEPGLIFSAGAPPPPAVVEMAPPPVAPAPVAPVVIHRTQVTHTVKSYTDTVRRRVRRPVRHHALVHRYHRRHRRPVYRGMVITGS